MNVSIPKPTDLVLMTFQRNPLTPDSRPTIVSVRIIGSANPCTSTLQAGGSLRRALRCLLNNGFKIVCSGKSTDVSGFVLLQRK